MHKVPYSPEKLEEDFDNFMFFQDWPTSSPVVFAQYQVFASAHAAGFKVMLSGQGPDEYLAGYPFYISMRAAAEARRGRLDRVCRLLIQSRNRAPLTRLDLARHTLSNLLDAPLRWIGRRTVPMAPGYAGLNVFRAALHCSIQEAPLPGILRIEDANSMAASVENRVPFLTPTLVEFVQSLPDSFLVSPAGETKWVFREAMRGITPEPILNRRGKMGFPVPLAAWLRAMEGFCAQRLEETASLTYLDADQVRGTWRRFIENRTPGRQGSADVFRLWRWVFLAAWAKRFDVQFS
jgi:asparagine synthase (glutamine-hydrolysing)